MISVNPIANQSNGTQKLSISAERLITGKKTNSAADNAAGIAILERLESQGKAFNASIANANNGISMLNVADAASKGVHDGLQRLRELAVQSANGILSNEDREMLNTEAQHIQSEINRLTSTTEFNGRKVLASDSALNIQLGQNSDHNITISSSNLDTALLDQGLGSINLSAQHISQNALNTIDDMISTTSRAQSHFGAQINRLTSSVANLQDQAVITNKARSQIEDADYAKEAANYTSSLLQEKVSIAVQSQANASAGHILALLNKN